ncbi:gliding motility-associated protein GldE [Pontibacter sp. H249]|uniref:gliding motility-associated protein GldE n=1 Tax=Pontibacter sp. H249 TaxID=3133420 RepID=UPI0030BC10F6
MESTDPDPLSYSLLQLFQTSFDQLRIEYIAAVFAGFILLLLSALVSGAEAAFFSLSERELDNCKNSSDPNERSIYHLLQNPRKLLNTLLVFNNGINVSIITFFAYIAWQLSSTRSLPTPTLVACALFLTFFIVFFGELLPKVYVQTRQLAIARSTVPLIKYMQAIAKPLSWIMSGISNYIDKHYMIRGYNHTIEELHHSLDVALTNEETSPEERKILRGVVNFGVITVKQIMRPRLDIIAFDANTKFTALLPQIVKWGYSRVPVYTESTDRIDGILYVKDLLPYLDQGDDFNWLKLLRPPFYIPENTRIADLYKDFKEKHVHMAIVINEYGTTVGLLTLEDIIEEIVGEINDEFDDDDDIIYSQLDENTFIFDGKTSLHDFCKIAELPFDAFNEVKGENETVAGLMLALFSRIPRVGEEAQYSRFHFTVESADAKRVKRVKINVRNKKEHYHKAS